jgi:hypothetical protein
MFFNGRLFLRALSLHFLGPRPTLRRWAYGILFVGLFAAFRSVVWTGWWVDRLLFPKFRRQPVRSPVFIIAPPRSGTTLTQRLLSLDEERFVHWKLYQTIFPAICLQRLISGMGRVDAWLGRPIGRLLGVLERRCLGGWDGLHTLRLNQPEEDDALFLYGFASEAAYLLFPYTRDLWELGFLDALPEVSRRRLSAYYRECLQRHLHANGHGRTLLSKATQSCGFVDSLLTEFPDARFITIVRHPDQSIASHVSLFIPAWRHHSPEIAKDGPEAREYAELAVEWYRHLHAFRDKVPPSQHYCIDYRDLVRDPGATVRSVYGHFGWEMSEAFASRLEEETRRHRGFSSRHDYSLDRFGLSREWVRERLGPILEFHGLES